MVTTWGIIGCGNIARRFAAALRESAEHRLVAAASRDLERARVFAAAHGAARAYPDYQQLLDDPEVEAVYIATPHPSHARWSLRALEAGKRVLCEKPAAMSRPQLAAVLDAATEHRRPLLEAFMYRHHPQIERLRQLLRERAIGEVRLLRASFGFDAGGDEAGRLLARELGGGGIMDVGCYPASLAVLVARESLGADALQPEAVEGQAQLAATGVDAWAVAQLRFRGGLLAQLATGVQLGMDNDAVLFGSQGTIRLNRPWGGAETRIVIERHGQPREELQIHEGLSTYAREAEALSTCPGLEHPAMPWADSLATAAILDRWREAVGVRHPGQEPDGCPAPIRAERVTPGSHARIPQASLPGLDKPVSRLVIGAQRDLQRAAPLWDRFVELGGNAFDTSWWYGQGATDRCLGRWIEARGLREQVVILAKGAHTPGCHPEELDRQLRASLDFLRSDRVELYLMHRDNPEVPVDEFVDLLNEHHRAGRIGVFGGSNWTVERIRAANAYAESSGQIGFGAISNNFSLARMVNPVWEGCLAASAPDQLPFFQQTKTPLLPWSSQARGFFVRGDPARRDDAELVNAWYSEDNFERLRRARELGERLGVSANNVALAYVLHQDFPTFPLVGPADLGELRSTLPALELTLSPEQLAWLDLREPAPVAS